MDGLAALDPRLTRLVLDGNPQLGDATGEHLARQTNLGVLSLDRTGIGDAGLAHLAGLEQLTRLTLSGTKLSDAGLELVAKLPQLESLELYQTAVSGEALARLKAQRPELEVSR